MTLTTVVYSSSELKWKKGYIIINNSQHTMNLSNEQQQQQQLLMLVNYSFFLQVLYR